MYEMIDVKENARSEAPDVLGWRVLISPRVWERCVAVPKGVEGQTEGGRLHDLLAFLGFNLRRLAAPRQDGISAGFGFRVNVVNDNRKRSECPDGHECPGEAVPLEVLASFGEDGGPRLVVLAQSEASALRMEHD